MGAGFRIDLCGGEVSASPAVSQGAPTFNELGFFVVDDEAGSVNGLLPGDPHYADAVFSQPQRQVLYSRLGTFKTESTTEYAGDQRLGVYILQQTTTRPDDTSFFILPNGELIQWLGSFDETAKAESLIAMDGNSIDGLGFTVFKRRSPTTRRLSLSIQFVCY